MPYNTLIAIRFEIRIYQKESKERIPERLQEIGEKILQVPTKGVGFWLGVKSATVKGREEFEDSTVTHKLSSFMYSAYKIIMCYVKFYARSWNEP